MDRGAPLASQRLSGRQPGKIIPPAVEKFMIAIRPGPPDKMREPLGEHSEEALLVVGLHRFPPKDRRPAAAPSV